jgi:hypothetical protein
MILLLLTPPPCPLFPRQYRNSMMTSVLRDSLGGNCKTLMVATISAERANTDESISTCRFAQRVAMIKNDAIVNEEVDPALIIRRLRGEIAELKAEVGLPKAELRLGIADRRRMRRICDLSFQSYRPGMFRGDLTRFSSLQVAFLKGEAGGGGELFQEDEENLCSILVSREITFSS